MNNTLISVAFTVAIAGHSAAGADAPVATPPNPVLHSDSDIATPIAGSATQPLVLPSRILEAGSSLLVGTPLTSYTKFSAQGALSGTLTGLAIDGQTSPYAAIVVTGDTATPTQATSALTIVHKFGGNRDAKYCDPAIASRQCSHLGIWVNEVKTAPSPGVAFDTGVFSNLTLQASGAAGFVQSGYGYAAQVTDDAGGYYGVTGGEIDISFHAGTTKRKEGWSVASAALTSGPDAYHGALYDAGYGLWAAGGCPGAAKYAGAPGCSVGFNIGFSIGRDDTYWPISPTGTVFGITPGVSTQLQAAHGIDLSAGTFTSAAFKSNGFQVDGAGDVIAKSLLTRHINASGTAPTLGAGAGDCGTGPAIVGNDTAGRVTVGSSNNGGKCTITFTVPYGANAPVCSVWNESSTARPVYPIGTTTTALAITAASALSAGDKLAYQCIGIR